MRRTPEPGARRVPLRRSIVWRSFLSIVVVTTVTMVGIVALGITRSFRQDLRSLEVRAESQARFLATVSPEAMFVRDFLALETLAREAVEDPAIVHALFVDTNDSSMTRFIDVGEPHVIAAIGDADRLDSATLGNRLAGRNHLREVRLPIVSEGVQLGEVRLYYSIESVRSTAIRSLAEATAVTIVALLLVVALTVLVLRRQLRRPLVELTERTDAMARGDFADLDVRTEDEIGVLQQSFNDMARDLSETLTGLEQARDRAQAADRAKSEFLANMSHEIRTPLNAVLGLSDVLLDSELTDDQRELLTTMHRSGVSLLHLVNAILDYSKLDSGRLELETEPFGLVEQVADTIDMFAGEAATKGITLRSDVGELAGETVLGDAGRLRQVLVNLVGNAMKFTEHGDVVVSVRRLDGTDRVRVEVSDTGIGFDPERADNLFEPFEQGDSTTTRRYGGTGLGLAISKRLVEDMGGTIRASSHVGTGSVFTVEVPLPVVEVPSADVVGVPSARLFDLADRHPLRILVAEDNAVNRTVAQRMFERLGYRVDLAHDGVEAVDLALTGGYDLVLMDIQMPRLDGVEAAARIRSGLRGGVVPRIVAFTAHALEGDRERYLAMGMDGYLTKPVRLEELAEVLLAASGAGDAPATREPTEAADDRPHRGSGGLDRDELRRLFGDEADAVLAEVLPIFRTDAAERVATMRRAIECGDAGVLAREAHALKGSARSLAATGIARVCEEIEVLGRSGDVEPAVQLVDVVEAGLDHIG